MAEHDHQGAIEHRTPDCIHPGSHQPISWPDLAYGDPRRKCFTRGIPCDLRRGGWAHTIYCYALVLIGILFVAQMLVRSGQLLRWQAVVVILAATAPFLVHVAQDGLGILPVNGINLTPYALAITGPILAWSFYRLRVRDIVPVAHDQVLESIADALLVLDGEDRVLDLNLAAERLFGRTRRAAFGQPIELVWPKQSEYLPPRLHDATGSREVVSDPGQQHTYDVLTSPLADQRGRHFGRVDLTPRYHRAQVRRGSLESA